MRLEQLLLKRISDPINGIRGRGLGDEKKGNMQDVQDRLYIVLLVYTLLTRNCLFLYKEQQDQIQQIVEKSEPILFLNRGYVHIG